MKERDKIANAIVNQKLTLITTILDNLGLTYDFHFMLHATLLDRDNKKTINEYSCINRNINTNVLNACINDLLVYKYDQETIMQAIGAGKLIVMCIDANTQVEPTVDKLQLNKCYVVEHLKREGDDDYKLVLNGMDAGTCTGYPAARFVQLFNSYNAN